MGNPGLQGPPGRQGVRGEQGSVGLEGDVGYKGSKGTQTLSLCFKRFSLKCFLSSLVLSRCYRTAGTSRRRRHSERPDGFTWTQRTARIPRT